MIPQDKHLTSIDCLRGFAALIVCYYHFTCGNSNFLPDDSLLKITGKFGYLGVEIFFIISGFVLPLSMKGKYNLSNFWLFISKRLLRLDPPYLTVIALILILNYISTLSPYYRGKNIETDIIQIILHIGYLNTFFNREWLNPVFWTLAIEFQFYILLGLFYPFLIKRFFLYLFIVVSIGSSFLIDDNNYILKYLPFFCLGLVFFKFYSKEFWLIESSILISILYCAIFIRFNIEYLFASLIPLIILFDSNIKNSFLLFLGKISYSLYLLHIPIGMRLINLSEGKIEGIIIRELIVFLTLIISIIISWAFYSIIEKPSIKFSRKVNYKYILTLKSNLLNRRIND